MNFIWKKKSDTMSLRSEQCLFGVKKPKYLCTTNLNLLTWTSKLNYLVSGEAHLNI